jgi:hypothetical protein
MASLVWVRRCIVLALFGSIASFAGAAGVGSWRNVAPLPIDRGEHTTMLLADGRVLAAAGMVTYPANLGPRTTRETCPLGRPSDHLPNASTLGRGEERRRNTKAHPTRDEH